MRMGEEVGRRIDGSMRNVRALQPADDIVPIHLPHQGFGSLSQAVVLRSPPRIRSERRLGPEIVEAKLLAECSPLAVAGHADENMTPISRLEHLVDAPSEILTGAAFRHG